jgi:hypothetical protein
VVHPGAIAYGQSFDSGIGGSTEEPGTLRQAMKLHYKDLGQPVMSASGRRPAKIKRPGTVPTAENYQITLKQHNEFKRTLDSLDEAFLIEVGPIDWAKSKIGAGLDKVSPGLKDKLKGWWQNVWHGSRNPLNPQNLQKWDVALDDILDTFSTQLKGRVKGIISQQFDPSKGLISKHIQNLAKPYHKDTGSSSAKPPESPSEAPGTPEGSSTTSSKDSGKEAPKATEPPRHGIGTAGMASTTEPRHILTPAGKLRKWFKNDILAEFRTDEGINLDGLKARLKKDGYDSDVIKSVIELAGQKPKQPKPRKYSHLFGDADETDAGEEPKEEPKLQAPTISGDPKKNARNRVDRVMGKLPKNSKLSREQVKELLGHGMSEDDIIDVAERHSHHGDVSEHDHPTTEECLPAKKGIKSLEEYLREAATATTTTAPATTATTTKTTTPTTPPAAPATTPPAAPTRPINDDLAAKKLLDIMDKQTGGEWRLLTFANLDNSEIENHEQIDDATLKKWSDDIVKIWKRQKNITQLSEEDVENMANFHLEDMGFITDAEETERYDWFSKRGKEKSLDQISKIE